MEGATVVERGVAETWRARHRQYWWCLGILAVAYVGLFGWLLAATDGLPYVYDNNETFSSLWHAHNLFSFDFTRSWGLTDEAYGPNPAAHPFVHTHQGNFPRLFAFVIYALGSRTAESQILVTTFTVGVVAMFFAFEFLRRRAGPAFGLTACLVFMTDYLFYTQWHVVTYRVWHLFFVFGTLLCIEQLGGRRWRLWSVLTFLIFAALFYFELIFAAFVAILAGLYALWLYARRPRTLLLAWCVEGLGALFALGVLVLQLKMYLGVRALAEDLYLTFFARNRIADDPTLQDRLDAFYRSHNIVFWFNLVDVRGLRSPLAFVQQVYSRHLEVLTPFLVLLVLMILAGWLVGALADRGAVLGDGARRWWRARSSKPDQSSATAACQGGGTGSAALRAALVLALLVIPSLLFVVTVIRDQAYMGLPISNASFAARTGGLVYAELALVGLVVVVATLLALPRWRVLARLPLIRVSLAGLLLLGFASFVRVQGMLTNLNYSAIWFDRVGLWAPLWLNAAVTMAAAGAAMLLVVFGPRRALGPAPGQHLLGLVPYLGLSSLAFIVTYLLSPGYVVSGYLARTAPMTVFVVDVALAVGLYLLPVLARRALTLAGQHWRVAPLGRARRALGAVALAGGSLAALGVFVFMVGYWLNMQRTYLTLLPPTHFAFLKTLAEPPFRGASIASNTYAAPAAAYTGQWAYIDATLARARITLSDDGYAVAQELQTYVWLADRRTNPEYRRPDYYLCMRYQSLLDAVYRLRGTESSDGACSTVPIVRRADGSEQPFLQYRVVARDPTPFDGWVIVKLDWDFPPYLRPLPGTDGRTRVGARATPDPGGTLLDVDYVYAHQEGKPEGDTVIRVYRHNGVGVRCLLSEQHGGGPIRLPPGLAGTVQVSVQPGTTTKQGSEYFSDDVVLGSDTAGDGACPRAASG